ncbi:Cancer susceptibility candidate 1 [Nesidiocoris tenuis]|uniref:Cancer susceptibility candidate 1 n=1 Tax=Nesidiocoris tenuis TaxID=355587 RepID=A0ABN7A846_9HEMI|nr:Cancer susceptibility candidate 1 [Nesidiocoris tenuis]
MGPKKVKRKSKKQLKEEELMAERLKQEEAEQKAREEEARQRELERLRIEAKLKAKTELMEQHMREEVLIAICKIFQRARMYSFRDKIRQREQEEWERFLRCDRLPYPESAPNMNTHLYLWRNVDKCDNMESATDRAETMLAILGILDDMIEEPLDVKRQTVRNWKEVRESYRYEMMDKIDLATFNLIRTIEESMNRIDFWTVEFKKTTLNITIGMWAWLDEPVSETDKRAPPCVDFKESGVLVRLPVPYNKKFVILRTMRTIFDHYSDTSKTYNEPESNVTYDLFKKVSKWYEDREALKREHERVEAENRKIEEQLRLETESLALTEIAETSTTASVSDDAEGKTTEGESDSVKEEVKSPSPEPLNDIVLPDRKFQAYLGSELDPDEATAGNAEKAAAAAAAATATAEEKEANAEDVIYDDYLELICPKSAPYPGAEGVRSIYQLVKEFDKAAAEEEQRLYESKNIKKCLETLYDISIPDKPLNGGVLLPPPKNPNEVIEERIKAWWNQFIISMEVNVSFHELNLRKFSVLGGVYYIDLIKHVPQSAILKDGSRIQIHYGDYNIDKEEFFFVYEPPKITETKEDEEEKPPPDDNIDRLISIEITLPQYVLWFEAPTVVQWNKDEKYWSNEHIYDIRFNEEKQLISCRIGKTDPIGLAAVRYNNLPFQTWELRPDWQDRRSIFLSLTASTVILEFLVQGKKVALQSLQNATGTALEPIIGEFFFPRVLVKKMKRAGVDVFPCYDTFLYVEGNAVKSPVIEEHVYLCMAMFCNVYQFTWSRWNLPAGREKVVFQTREVLSKQNLPPYMMIMSNLYRTVVVNCSEVTPAFTEQSKPDYGFYPDLYSLLSNVTSPRAMEFAVDLDIDLILSVYQLLLFTKVLSFS